MRIVIIHIRVMGVNGDLGHSSELTGGAQSFAIVRSVPSVANGKPPLAQR